MALPAASSMFSCMLFSERDTHLPQLSKNPPMDMTRVLMLRVRVSGLPVSMFSAKRSTVLLLISCASPVEFL